MNYVVIRDIWRFSQLKWLVILRHYQVFVEYFILYSYFVQVISLHITTHIQVEIDIFKGLPKYFLFSVEDCMESIKMFYFLAIIFYRWVTPL